MTSCSFDRTNQVASSLFFNDLHPIRIDSQNIYHFENLQINYQNLNLALEKGDLFKIECDKGVTGVLIMSRGFLTHYNNTNLSKNRYPIRKFILFRFHPDHFANIISDQEFSSILSDRKTDTAWELMKKHFSFAYANNMDALITEVGSYAVLADQVSIQYDASTSLNQVSLSIH